jgi:Lipocalin-like domain
MKNNNFIRVGTILLSSIILIIGSCKKEVVVSRTQLLSRDWQQTDLIASIAGSAPTSVFTTVMDACVRDNIWQFKADGTYSVSEGASKCNAADPDIATTGTWQLIDNDSKLVIDDVNELPQTFTITELTSASLKITGTEIIQGNSVTATAVFQSK